MPSATTTESFIKKSKQIHGNKFSYKSCHYVNSKTRVTLVCKKHKEVFDVLPPYHFRSKGGCPKCRDTTTPILPFDTFKRRASIKHKNKYIYSPSRYKGVSEKVKIKCPQHGVFYSIGSNHLRGTGCSKCSREGNTDSKQDFIRKAELKHSGFYNYKKAKYKNSYTKIKITCPLHGDFLQTPNNHLNGQGCPVCKTDKIVFSKTGYKQKEYQLGNIKVYLQGYEPYALDYLLKEKGLEPRNIKVTKDVPVFTYYDPVKKRTRKYYPDIYIPNQNRIIEVKSPFTLNVGKRELVLKRASCISAGYKFTLLVFSANGSKLPVKKNWHINL